MKKTGRPRKIMGKKHKITIGDDCWVVLNKLRNSDGKITKLTFDTVIKNILDAEEMFNGYMFKKIFVDNETYDYMQDIREMNEYKDMNETINGFIDDAIKYNLIHEENINDNENSS